MTDILVIPAYDDASLVIPVESGSPGAPGAPGAAGGNVMAISSRAAANGSNVSGAALVRTSGAATAGDGGDAFYKKDSSVNLATYPQAGFTDNGGQKYRIGETQPLNSQMFYDATDSSYGQCIQRGLDYLHDQAGHNGGGPNIYRGTVPLRVPAGDYISNIPIDVRQSVDLFGDGSGDGGNAPAAGVTHIHFVGCSGFRIQHPTTYGDTNVDVSGNQPAAGRARVRQFMLTSDSPTNRTRHAVIQRGMSDVWDIYARDFGGCAVRNWTGNFRGVAYGGNTSTSTIQRVKGQGCQGTISIGGTDSNLIQTDGCQGYQNQQFGLEDGNAAGANKHRGFHATFNGYGVGAGGPFAACSYSGNIYTPNLQGLDFTNAGTLAAGLAALNAHPPSGTTAHNAYWLYCAPGGVSTPTPAYSSGGPWTYGGDMLAFNAFSVEFDSCYMEGGGLLSQSFYRHPVWFGGTIDRSQLYGGTLLKSTDDAWEVIRTNAANLILRARDNGSAAFSIKDYSEFLWWEFFVPFGGSPTEYVPNTKQHSNASAANIWSWNYNGINLGAGKKLSINGVDVLTGQMAAIADLGAAPTQADFNNLLAKLRSVKLLA